MLDSTVVVVSEPAISARTPSEITTFLGGEICSFPSSLPYGTQVLVSVGVEQKVAGTHQEIEQIFAGGPVCDSLLCLGEAHSTHHFYVLSDSREVFGIVRKPREVLIDEGRPTRTVDWRVKLQMNGWTYLKPDFMSAHSPLWSLPSRSISVHPPNLRTNINVCPTLQNS